MQVPSHVQYERAESVEHALQLLIRSGPGARLLAGGHSLIPMMKLRLAQPETLVDVGSLAELSGIAVDGDELRIGALVRHAELLASHLAGEHFPIFHDAERVIADPIVRNWGTVGGSLCQADPSEDLSAVFAAVSATAVVRGPDGVRAVPVRQFHTGPYETVLAADEILTALRVPIRPGGGSAYAKVGRRVGDWAVAAAGAVVWLGSADSADSADSAGSAAGTGGARQMVADAGIGLTAVGAGHFVAPEAEQFLRGQPADDATFRQAGAIAAEHCHPAADQRGPADYKRHLAAELTARALRRAAARAAGQEA
jgi:aerobic carbon-monoxide dehydrogenase medium subunit